MAFLLHRAAAGPGATTPEGIRHWATRGGAELLGFDTGRIAEGAAADLVFYDLTAPRFAGLWQPDLAPVLCGEPVHVARAMVAGRWTVRDGSVVGVDAQVIASRAAAARARLTPHL